MHPVAGDRLAAFGLQQFDLLMHGPAHRGEEGFSPCTFDDGAAFLAACELLPPGCVITGYQTGDMDALEFLGRLGAKPVFFPIIIIADTGEVTQAVEAMKAGSPMGIERAACSVVVGGLAEHRPWDILRRSFTLTIFHAQM